MTYCVWAGPTGRRSFPGGHWKVPENWVIIDLNPDPDPDPNIWILTPF